MPLTINSSIASLNAHRSLRNNTSALSKTFARLSSGLRINSASDDAAGLAMSAKLKAAVLSTNAAVRNNNDGISMMQVADAALAETSTALQRIRELAVQSNTTTMSGTDQNNLQLEVTELMAEIQRISTTTEFNNMDLLDGSFSTTKAIFQIGADAGQTMVAAITSAGADSIGASTGTAANGISVGSAAYDGGYISTTIDNLDIAIDSVSAIRAQIGAYQNRFESAVNSLSAISEATETARARIVDADIAAETSKMTRLSILQQAGVAVLAQANQQPAIAYRLLDSLK
ncbi:MAG: flagellin FliC [Magnetococcales bacterium]|nr:flagellin FliC [Magnetococcales bacterium]